MKKFLIGLVLSVALVGGVAAEASERLKRTEVPKKGRYTVVVQDSGVMDIRLDAQTGTGGTAYHVMRPLGVAAAYRDAIVAKLKARGGFEYVPTEARIEQAPSMQGFEVRFPPGDSAQLTELATEHALDLVIVVSETTVIAQLAGTQFDLIGNGVYDRKQLGFLHFSAAYSAFLVTVFDPRNDRVLAYPGFGLRKLGDDWPEVTPAQRPDADLIARAAAEIEASVAESTLDATLCTVGLLPGTTTTDPYTSFTKCRDYYKKQRKR